MSQTKITEEIIALIRSSFPDMQAIYLYGSWGTENEFPNSDVDIALLLPEEGEKNNRALKISKLGVKLGDLLKKDVDLVDLREVSSTVLQKEVIAAERRIYCGDQYRADEFEMLTISYYQKLNEERKEIVNEFLKTKRAYAV